ncbi:unnamed protein product, partial [Heterosigma akashiwo]
GLTQKQATQAKKSEDIFQIIIKGDGKGVTEYVQHGNDVNAKDSITGNALLHWAAWK